MFLQNTDLPDQVKLSKLQKGLFVFQLKVTDTDGHSADDRVRVLVLSPEQSGCKCSWEMELVCLFLNMVLKFNQKLLIIY